MKPGPRAAPVGTLATPDGRKPGRTPRGNVELVALELPPPLVEPPPVEPPPLVDGRWRAHHNTMSLIVGLIMIWVYDSRLIVHYHATIILL